MKKALLFILLLSGIVYFGSCTNHGECESVCPMEISTKLISKMNREYLRSTLAGF